MSGRLAGLAAAVAPVLPPRPNLGPEPWPSAWTTYGPFVTTALIALAIGLLAWRVYGRSRARDGAGEPGREADSGAPPGATPLVVWSERVRVALADRLGGTGWAARTTEELADDPTLTTRLGPESAARLVRFLRAADRAKFADDAPASRTEIEAWSAWAAAFVAGEEAKAPPDDADARSPTTVD